MIINNYSPAETADGNDQWRTYATVSYADDPWTRATLLIIQNIFRNFHIQGNN